MHRKYTKFIFISFIVFIVLGYYTYSYKDLISEAAPSDTLSSSLEDENNNNKIPNNKVLNDTSFLMKLTTLERIKIDSSIFSDKGFSLLVDNKIKLETPTHGRINPFSPIGKNPVNTTPNINISTYKIKTSIATEITETGAFINGVLEGSSSENMFFEYGTTDALGKVTPKVTPSMAGSFSYYLGGLKEKTKYYYRAVANVNGTNIFGETISFNTN